MIKTIVITFLASAIVTLLLVLIGCIIALVKNEVTFRNHLVIGKAILAYHLHLLGKGQYQFDVTYDDMEDYDATQKRFWDWGYTRILPPEKFELIKPFIEH